MKRTISRLSLSLLVMTTACGDESGSDGPLRCQYEQAKTACNGSTYGAYTSRCLDVDDPKEGLTPSGWCNIVIADTRECAGSCCVRYRFRNAVGSYGKCP